MQYYGDKILANFAYGSATSWQAIWKGASRSVPTLGGFLWAHQYHIWTLEWDENMMHFLLDGDILNTIDLSSTFNKIDGKNPFRQLHHLLLNLAMGGTNGGSLTNTVLPSKYFIDYVRIYQKK